jgi:hypothetical protein
MHWLEQALDNGRLYLLRVAGDPRFDWLSGNQRFQALVARMGLRTGGSQPA